MSSQFDAETEAALLEPGRWAVRLSSRWNIGDNANGGYLVATAVRAMGELVDHPDPVTVTTHFLRPGVGDAAGLVGAEVVRSGRSLSTVRGRLSQLDTTRVELLAGFGDLTAGPTDRALDVAPPELPPPDDCVPRIHLEQGIDLPILDRVDVRIHPDQAAAGASDRALVSGWVRFGDGRDPDPLALTLFCDVFPPSVFARYGHIGWVPTIELTVHVRRRPEPGWIRAAFETDDLHGGRFVETGTLWDSSGRVVARVRQLAMLLTR